MQAKLKEHPRQSVTLTILHSKSIGITLRHGSHSENFLLTSSTKTYGGLLLKRESYL